MRFFLGRNTSTITFTPRPLHYKKNIIAQADLNNVMSAPKIIEEGFNYLDLEVTYEVLYYIWICLATDQLKTVL